MRTRTAALFLVLLTTVGLIGFDAAPAAALSSAESCFYNAINRERAKVGHSKLALKDDLTSIARRHSKQMAADHTIYHNNNLGNEISGNWYAAGENVGMGPDCPTIHDAFMSSPGHRANILDTDYNQVGVGVSTDENGTVYVTEDFAGRRSATVHRTVTRARAPQAKPPPPRPQPARVLLTSEPRTVVVLLQLLGLDAKRVNAATGEALGV